MFRKHFTWDIPFTDRNLILASSSSYLLTRDLISFSIPGPCHNGKIFTLLFGIVQKSSKSVDQKVSFS